MKPRAPAACRCSTPGALLFNCGPSRTFFPLLPLKGLIDFYTRLLPLRSSALKENPSSTRMRGKKKKETCQQVSRCLADTSAPTLNNHPDVDFFIFNPTILDCFCENKNIKIPTLSLSCSLSKNMFFVVVAPPQALNHSLETGTGVYSLHNCLYRTKITSIKFD